MRNGRLSLGHYEPGFAYSCYSGGERLLLNMKDKDDPDDGSQANLEVVLSEQWDTYEFDLADFENADLSKLHIVLGLLILNQIDPLSFAVRAVRFLEPDE